MEYEELLKDLKNQEFTINQKEILLNLQSLTENFRYGSRESLLEIKRLCKLLLNDHETELNNNILLIVRMILQNAIVLEKVIRNLSYEMANY
ncbi:MAG: hypothetical protein ACFFAS_11790 [Promethearchaeota archaeon]